LTGRTLGPAAAERLTAAGWRPGRAVAIEPFLEPLLEEEYEIPEVLREFLRGYGGLEFTYQNPQNAALTDTCTIDPSVATNVIYPIRVRLWGGRIGAELCPFGEAGGMSLVMAADGRVWAGRDELLIVIGDSPEDALDSLCENRPTPEVPGG
jgi:SUKH-3 immunity protein